MACSSLHILIAEQYCKEHNIHNTKPYLEGAILPDIQADKVSSHFGKKIRPTSLKEALEAKIDIKECINSLNFNDETQRGIFLHLLTDYIYYNFLYEEKFESISLPTILASIANDASVMTKEITKKHNISLPEKYHQLIQPKEDCGKYLLFKGDKLNNFIKLVSSLQIDDAKKSILKNEKDFLNNCLITLNCEQAESGSEE